MTSDELKEIYASAPVSKTMFELISLYAPWYSQAYHLQNVSLDPINVTLETGATISALYCPMAAGQANSNADLNHERTVKLQYVNDIIATERSYFDPSLHDWFEQTITSRGYIYYRDGTISNIQTTPINLPVRDIISTWNTSEIRISTQPVNRSKTGEIFTTSRIPMLLPYA